ncbi:DMT family transporter [Streptomyces sp. NA04227]|uniref:DMT family transporter n=1 Tax=Streptomyces sp. NA04227 TaxID=2742136 RepID=UPI00159250E5|nr:DMT family transporter [Streptomyces sp. NA04227]QKW10198.1 DMT family transporter [Streptomyces sp. NA04227]
MSATLLAVLLSLLSAVAYAAAAVSQERLAARTGDSGMRRLLSTGSWWGAVSLNSGGALLHVAALKFGSLTLVQPLGALTLVAAVPLGARMAHRRVARVEWRGTLLTLIGLSALMVTATGPAPEERLSFQEALLVAAASSCLIAMLCRGRRPGLRFATASGIASGLGSALTQTVTVAVTDDGASPLDLKVITVAVLVAGFAAGSLLLAQTAFRYGLGAPLAVVTLSNPIAAAAIGVTLLGERFAGGPLGLLLALLGALLAGRGVFLLARAAHPEPRSTTVLSYVPSQAGPLRQPPPLALEQPPLDGAPSQLPDEAAARLPGTPPERRVG